MSNSELDRIISEGKVNSSTAMIIFAVELKSQGEKIDQLKNALDEDNKRYVTQKDHEQLEKRVKRIEDGALKVLVTVFLIVLTAAVGITIYAGRN